MKVWIVMAGLEWESETIMGIYSSLEKAEVRKSDVETIYGYDYVYVEEIEIDVDLDLN